MKSAATGTYKKKNFTSGDYRRGVSKKLGGVLKGKENIDKLAEVARVVKQVMKFRLIWANFFKDALRTGILLHCVSH